LPELTRDWHRRNASGRRPPRIRAYNSSRAPNGAPPSGSVSPVLASMMCAFSRPRNVLGGMGRRTLSCLSTGIRGYAPLSRPASRLAGPPSLNGHERTCALRRLPQAQTAVRRHRSEASSAVALAVPVRPRRPLRFPLLSDFPAALARTRGTAGLQF
jgi:hypothetical protein